MKFYWFVRNIGVGDILLITHLKSFLIFEKMLNFAERLLANFELIIYSHYICDNSISTLQCLIVSRKQLEMERVQYLCAYHICILQFQQSGFLVPHALSTIVKIAKYNLNNRS